MRPRVRAVIVVVSLAAVMSAGCALTIRDNVRKAALVSGEIALGIDQAERDLYASGVYSAEKHKQVGAAILVALTAVRSFERAARAWPEKVTMPQNVPQAMVDALAAIAAVERIVEGIPGNGKLLANLNKAKIIIGGK